MSLTFDPGVAAGLAISATVAIVMGVITAVIAYVVQVRGTRQENR